MMTTKDSVSLLNDLVQTCRDGEQGFQEAAEAIQDSELRALFTQYAQQRARLGGELAAEVRHLGGNPEQRGSVAGAVHRGWMNVKSAITGKDDDAIVSECERGEDIAKAAYETALQADTSANLQALLRRHYDTVKETHDRIRSLERAHQH